MADGYYPVGEDCVLYHAYWDGTAVDHSEYGRDGSVNGSTFVENGLSFDGNNDYVRNNDPITVGTSDYGIMVWIKLDATAGAGRIFDIVGTGLFDIFVYEDGTSFRHWNIWPGSAWNRNGTHAGVEGVWHHITSYIDRDVGLKMYADTVQILSFGGNWSAVNLPASAINVIGINGNDLTTYPLKAIIGEILVFKGIPDYANHFNATKSRYGYGPYNESRAGALNQAGEYSRHLNMLRIESGDL